MDTAPGHGTVSVGHDGTYTYVPYATYSGMDSFKYTVVDQYDQSASGTVSIMVQPKVTGAPTAANYSETTPFNTELSVNTASGLTSNDTGTSP